jgi:hypothetical protein
MNTVYSFHLDSWLDQADKHGAPGGLRSAHKNTMLGDGPQCDSQQQWYSRGGCNWLSIVFIMAFAIHGAESLLSTTRLSFFNFYIALNFIQVGQHLNCNDKGNNIQSGIFQM